jgi:hypothetical protein
MANAFGCHSNAANVIHGWLFKKANQIGNQALPQGGFDLRTERGGMRGGNPQQLGTQAAAREQNEDDAPAQKRTRASLHALR